MRYPVFIEPGTGTTAFGVVVPDLPGCFSAGDTLKDAVASAQEATVGWIDAAFEAGQAIPAPSDLSMLRDNPDYSGWTCTVIAVPRRAA